MPGRVRDFRLGHRRSLESILVEAVAGLFHRTRDLLDTSVGDGCRTITTVPDHPDRARHAI
jgi:hypothetical protein